VVVVIQTTDEPAEEDVGCTGARNVTLQAPLGEVHVHVRGGAIIPLQKPGLTVAEVRGSPLSLLVAMGALSRGHVAKDQCHKVLAQAGVQAARGEMSASACGRVYFDDGVSRQASGPSSLFFPGIEMLGSLP
jgi:hypothetical protein